MNSKVRGFLKEHGFREPESGDNVKALHADCLVKPIKCNGGRKLAFIYRYGDSEDSNYYLSIEDEFLWMEKTLQELILLALLDMECKSRALYGNNSRMGRDNYHVNSDICNYLYELCHDMMKDFKEDK